MYIFLFRDASSDKHQSEGRVFQCNIDNDRRRAGHLDTGQVRHYDVFQNRDASVIDRADVESTDPAARRTHESHPSVAGINGLVPTMTKILLRSIAGQAVFQLSVSVPKVIGPAGCCEDKQQSLLLVNIFKLQANIFRLISQM